MLRLCLVLWILACSCAQSTTHDATAGQPPVVRLHDGLRSIALGAHVSYARAAPDIGPTQLDTLDWMRSSDETINLGFIPDPVWVRIRVHNDSARDAWLLRVAFPLIDRIELYERPDRPPQVVGLSLPFHQRPIRARDFVLPLSVAPGAEQELLVRLRSEDTMQIALSLWRPDAFHAADRLETWGLGLYFGLSLVMVAYNLFLFLGVRDRSYLHYVAYILAFCLFTASQQGIAYEHLWPDWPWWAKRANPLLGGLSVFFAAQFTRTFLDLRTGAPRLDRAVIVIQIACVIHLPIALFGSFALSAQGVTGIAVVFVMTAVAAAVIRLRRGFAPARLYLLAFITLFLSAAAYALKTLGVLPTHFITSYGLFFGSAAEIVLLSLALASRIKQLERDRELALQARLRLADSFSRFVPHQFLRELGRGSIEEVSRGDAVERDMAILFTDIRGFTGMAERMSPDETFLFLNDYLESMSAAIDSSGGFVDKFIGDGIMALFPGSADDALGAALGLVRAVERCNARDTRARVRIGVGLNRGRVILGTVGSSTRMNTTVIGDAVNLAARIEPLTKLYQVSIIITDAVRAALARPEVFKLRELDAVRVRGKSEAVVLYQVYDADEPARREALDAILDEHGRGLALYRAGRFVDAVACFERCLERCPGDATARLYVERCRGHAEAPPPGWTGVSTLDGT